MLNVDTIISEAGRGVQFFSVLYNTIITQGGELASDEVIDQRLKLCQACPKFNAATNRCLICGCGIRDPETRALMGNLGNKIAHKASKCPLGKWQKEA